MPVAPAYTEYAFEPHGVIRMAIAADAVKFRYNDKLVPEVFSGGNWISIIFGDQ